MNYRKVGEKMNSIKKNFMYNAFYNVLVLILPLITAPYISRIMGAERIGIYSYSYSVASYFGLFILLGLSNYGNRTIAGVRHNKKRLSRTFWSIYTMQLLMAGIVGCIYIIYIIVLASNKLMACIQFIYLLSVAIDINWFFFGMEQFKLTVTRNTFLKILNVLLIFFLVKSKDDLYLYGLIMVIGPLIGQCILWRFLPCYISFERVHRKEVMAHVIPNLILFIPVIAISLYTIMDKIMLGIMSNMTEVGYYENANKITQIPTMAISALGTVMLPRISHLAAVGKTEESKKYLQKSLLLSVFLSSSLAFGISSVSKEFVPLFYGSGFDKCSQLIPILVISSIFISFSNVIRTQYLIPYKQDKIYIISVFMGAGVNLIINILLIPHIQSIGAAIGTLVAEFTVCTYQCYSVRKEIPVFRYAKQGLPFLISGIIMYILIMNILSGSNIVINLIIKVLIGAIVYLLLTGVYYILKIKKQSGVKNVL